MDGMDSSPSRLFSGRLEVLAPTVRSIRLGVSLSTRTGTMPCRPRTVWAESHADRGADREDAGNGLASMHVEWALTAVVAGTPLDPDPVSNNRRRADMCQAVSCCCFGQAGVALLSRFIGAGDGEASARRPLDTMMVVGARGWIGRIKCYPPIQLLNGCTRERVLVRAVQIHRQGMDPTCFRGSFSGL